jgi:hypothetical protein
MGEWLNGRFLLKVLGVRTFGHIDAGDGTEGTDRYFAEVVMAPRDSGVKPRDQVSVKFRNNGIRPDGKHNHRFYGEIGEFDGVDNDIQSRPGENLDPNPRTGCTWKNPFERPYRAIDCNGRPVNPEDVGRGIYFCLKCQKIVRWRSINNKPQFYHYPHYNPDCPWSVKGGEADWNEASLDPDSDYEQIWADSIRSLYENGLLYLLEGNENIDGPIKTFLERENDVPDDLGQELERISKTSSQHASDHRKPEKSKTGRNNKSPAPDSGYDQKPPPQGYDDYFEMAKNSGKKLNDVPDNHRDRKLCMAAVKNNPRALQFVPGELLDREMFLTAFGGNPSNITYYWDLLSFRKIFELADDLGVARANKHGITWSYEQLKYGEKI